MTQLTPFALKDAPALIEAVFPAQKISFEAQRERKSGSNQTLTAIGSFWKGRKPLFLVRSVVIGTLLPQTGNTEKDLEIFEMLMAIDDNGLSRRALKQNSLKPKHLASILSLENPWHFFAFSTKNSVEKDEVVNLHFPINTDELGINIRWNRDVSDEDKISLYKSALASMASYEEKAIHCKRPEEIDEEWLLKPVWEKINKYYSQFGISAFSLYELIEQLGVLRYGHRPTVGDSFSGGGSIPFEAARLGCNAYASDLNPVACMLTWGALNIIGSDDDKRKIISKEQQELFEKVDAELTELGVEFDSSGNRAKAFLYCLEATCPETGWSIPLAPSWVISKNRNIVAKLVANTSTKTFDIDVVENVSEEEMKVADNGTIQNGSMVYTLDGKTYRTPIKTLRGDHKNQDGEVVNKLRRWEKSDFQPKVDDIFRERLYAIQWITKKSINETRQVTLFTKNREEDQLRENKVYEILNENIASWQDSGFIPDMEIESGDKTDEPIKTRGWTHWHHLHTPRNLLVGALTAKHVNSITAFNFLDLQNFNSKLCRWATSGKRIAKDGTGKQVGGASDNATDTFSNQALNPNYNYAHRSFYGLKDSYLPRYHSRGVIKTSTKIVTCEAKNVSDVCDIWVTDPPYADAVHYHEITEFFIGWLRKNAPKPFDQWTWDSRRALAVKGVGDNFRKGMVNAYKAMADHMPDNGMQCVMFTHQDTSVWSDMIGIFWAAGLQVVGAWYIATETSTELKKGGYVQGTVILMLRKRPAGENVGFKQRLLPAVRAEVKRQIETMMHLNDDVKDKMGEPVFNDSDLQMAGYAAALKVLTAYTHIGGEDVTTFALKPRTKGEVTVIDEIVQQAAQAANSLLVPDGLTVDTWQKLSGLQRFYLRMMDIETTGASKLDNYQNFQKAFGVDVSEYNRVMGKVTANNAQLKRISEFASRDLTDSNELGSTWLGHLIIGLQQLLAEVDPQVVISQFQVELPDFMEIRVLLLDVLTFIENKAPEKATRDAAEVLGARLRNMRAIGN
ncbi:anti-phage-associated DUF1156 domain-containing protein [Shewanella psychrotolerans]|uniref:anti-phage-associated DUF1156 domain-containing protein n=1 Tax=Shewanella psychrotolerans TaxID=2864206 RepID=UPI001C65DD0E|nr:anti-phage-associated DUF1156 domain-containing protein [Shewanella psychrotolerans]QYK01738.1 DUF1156 domain-containing protein [Shewanella psychrotolerans]